MKCSIDKNQILCIYHRDSHTYGVANLTSDRDYIIVVKDYPAPEYLKERILDTDGIYNDIAYVKKSSWERLAKNNSVEFLECVFLPEQYKHKEDFIPAFEFDYEKVRRNFSEKASNSWVKCKKKLTIEKDYAPYIGKKSMWHSLRLLMFGIQLCTYGKITNYTEANKYYRNIVNGPNNWEQLKEQFQPVYNRLKTKFKESYKIH